MDNMVRNTQDGSYSIGCILGRKSHTVPFEINVETSISMEVQILTLTFN